MRLFINIKKNSVSAIGDYDIQTKKLVVLKGSEVSETISSIDNFRGAKSIEKYREKVVRSGIVLQDVEFKSASSAANFVTGTSTNGLIAWKDEEGRKLKDIIAKIETEKGVS